MGLANGLKTFHDTPAGLDRFPLFSISAPIPLEAGDANCDGAVNVVDAVHLISYVFNSCPELCCL